MLKPVAFLLADSDETILFSELGDSSELIVQYFAEQLRSASISYIGIGFMYSRMRLKFLSLKRTVKYRDRDLASALICRCCSSVSAPFRDPAPVLVPPA